MEFRGSTSEYGHISSPGSVLMRDAAANPRGGPYDKDMFVISWDYSLAFGVLQTHPEMDTHTVPVQ